MANINTADSQTLARITRPTLVGFADRAELMMVLARLIASGEAVTRPALAAATGLSRSVLESCLVGLENRGLVVSLGYVPSARRGRPADALGINPAAGVILVADLTPHHVRVVLAGLDQKVLGAKRIEFPIDAGPEAVLDRVTSLGRELMAELELAPDAVKAVITSVPGPVDTKRGVPVRPPIMPGWDNYPVADKLSEEFGCACRVDNDVNLMALGEARVLPEDQCPMLVVKVGTGIGGGMVTADGELHRGADGAACDIGHLAAVGGDQVICSCGKTGCIEALASAEAITRQLREATGNPDLTQRELFQAVRSGDPTAIRLIRDAANILGNVVASLVHVCNPARIVLAGPLTDVTDDLLAGVRSVVYQRALPLATRNLTLAHSAIGDMAGVVGAVVLGVETILSPAYLARRR
jgi:predicted NBD/HSP70 family sugar kinase